MRSIAWEIPKSVCRYSRLKGFSLIELLIVVTIALVLLGGALTAFTRYSDRRQVGSSVEELKVYLRSAQTKAAAGDLGTCTQLAGYRVQSFLTANTTTVSLQAECSAGAAAEAQLYILPPAVTVTPNVDALFQVLNAGVVLPENAASQAITVSNGAYAYTFVLFREGRMSEGAWE